MANYEAKNCHIDDYNVDLATLCDGNVAQLEETIDSREQAIADQER